MLNKTKILNIKEFIAEMNSTSTLEKILEKSHRFPLQKQNKVQMNSGSLTMSHR